MSNERVNVNFIVITVPNFLFLYSFLHAAVMIPLVTFRTLYQFLSIVIHSAVAVMYSEGHCVCDGITWRSSCSQIRLDVQVL